MLLLFFVADGIPVTVIPGGLARMVVGHVVAAEVAEKIFHRVVVF